MGRIWGKLGLAAFCGVLAAVSQAKHYITIVKSTGS